MANYKANATDSKNFRLTSNSHKIGELTYGKWYSFKAYFRLSDGKKYNLEPKGFWQSKIELTDGRQVLLEFKMGWKGILINTFFEESEKCYLLRVKSVFSNQFVLLDTDQEELLIAKTDLKWNRLNFDFEIETTPKFDEFEHKELLVMTILHCVNYFMTNSSG